VSGDYTLRVASQVGCEGLPYDVTIGSLEVKDASQIDAKGYDVISDRAFLNFRTLREAEAVCTCLNNICKET
jgi:hypothetical protein